MLESRMKIGSFVDVRGSLVSIDEFASRGAFAGHVPQPDELVGAWTFQVGPRELFGLGERDLIHDMWGYFLGSTDYFFEGEVAEFFYPSSANSLVYRALEDGRVEFRKGTYGRLSDPAYCNRKQFLSEVSRAAAIFRDFCIELFQEWEGEASFRHYMGRIDAALKHG